MIATSTFLFWSLQTKFQQHSNSLTRNTEMPKEALAGFAYGPEEEFIPKGSSLKSRKRCPIHIPQHISPLSTIPLIVTLERQFRGAFFLGPPKGMRQTEWSLHP